MPLGVYPPQADKKMGWPILLSGIKGDGEVIGIKEAQKSAMIFRTILLHPDIHLQRLPVTHPKSIIVIIIVGPMIALVICLYSIY